MVIVPIAISSMARPRSFAGTTGNIDTINNAMPQSKYLTQFSLKNHDKCLNAFFIVFPLFLLDLIYRLPYYIR